jgi:Polysaccharide biosynthesis enzyme WcbI
MSKLKALFIGNCQNSGLIHYLSKNKEFSINYEIKQYANWQLIENQTSLPMGDIQSADLFVYQPLRPVHGCYSTDPTIEGSIGYYVKDSCIKISYPYIFSSAMWPIVQAGYNQNRWFGSEIIEELVEKGLNKNDILNLYNENKINWKYQERFKNSLNILKQKESITDIIVSDFIEDNYKNELLFLIPQHPTSSVFLYVANKILEKLNLSPLGGEVIEGVNDAKIEDSTYHLPTCMFPLHKSAIEDYELNYGKEYLENSNKFYAQRISTYLDINCKI